MKKNIVFRKETETAILFNHESVIEWYKDAVKSKN